jgi:DNA repair exonuclease SbcCD ATPase subunit
MAMEGRATSAAVRKSKKDEDSAKAARLRERLERSLREAAEIEVELSRAEGAIQGVPHYSVIENRAHELGRRLSQQCQQQQMNELAAATDATARCPACETRCDLTARKRTVKTVDGDAELQELVGYCPCCRRSFFPATSDVGV